MVMHIPNLTFDQLKNRIVQERRKCFHNEIAHPISIHTERVSVPNTRKHLKIVATTNLSFATTVKVTTYFFMEENKQLEKDLAVAGQQIDHLLTENHMLSLTNYHMREYRESIFEEIKPLGVTMRQVYEDMNTLRKVVIPLHTMQKRSWENMKVLKVIHATIESIQEWGTKYINSPSKFARKTS